MAWKLVGFDDTGKFGTRVEARLTADRTADRNRANHTGTQTAATISDFSEAAQDAVAAMLAAGTGVNLSYNDAGNVLTVTSTGGGTGGVTDPETVRDTIGAALVGVGLVTVSINDAADTIVISTTATQNRSDASTDTLINAKAPIQDPTFTGTVTVPSPLVGTAAATKGYVDTAIAGGLTAATLASAFRNTDANNFYTSGAWPNRATATTDTARRVNWIGPSATPPPTTTGYFILGFDVFETTS